MDDKDRFVGWKYPEIEEGKPTKYNWVVQNKQGLKLGYKTDIGAFSYINAKYGVTIEDFAQIGSHCSVYSVSTIDEKNGPVILKKGCRLGSHSVVMPGVTIGETFEYLTFPDFALNENSGLRIFFACKSQFFKGL